MGIYVYKILPPSTMIDIDGLSVGLYAFAYKPWLFSGGENDNKRMHSRYVGPTERAWSGHTLPELIVGCDSSKKPIDGAAIFRWKEKYCSFYDTVLDDCEIVGYLSREGRGEYRIVEKEPKTC